MNFKNQVMLTNYVWQFRASANTAKEKEERRHQTLVVKLQTGYAECMQRLSTVSSCVSQ